MSGVQDVRYSAYKESGVEWIGAVPEGWRIKRLRDLCSYTKGYAFKSDDFTDFGIPVVKATDIKSYSIIPPTSFINPDQARRYTQVELKENDLIISTVGSKPEIRDSAVGQIAVVNEKSAGGLLNQNTVILRNDKETSKSYFALFLTANSFRNYLDIIARGTANQASIKVFETLNYTFLLPPLAEQTAIATYLDNKTAQIDRKIDLLSQKASQYGKLKQSLINETVTRGLDKSVPMKDSGVAWVGNVPEHWEVKRLKEIVSIQNSNVDKKSHDDEIPVRLCNYVDVYKNEFITDQLSQNFMWATADESEIKKFGIKNNNVLITKDSETADDIAIPALATETLDGVLCGYHLAQIKTNPQYIMGSYLFRLFQSRSYGYRFEIMAKGITRVGLGQAAIADAITPMPPLVEQTAIAAYLDEKTEQIDRITTAINNQINKLKELRKALINDVVTGKIKVVSEEQTRLSKSRNTNAVTCAICYTIQPAIFLL